MGNYQTQRATSQLSGSNAAYIEALYEQYLDAPDSVAAEWRAYFDGIRAGASNEKPRLPVQERFEAMADLPDLPGGEADPEAIAKQVAVLGLISGYRTRGHQAADLCPIHLRPRREVPDIDYRWHGLTDADLDRTFNTGTLFSGDMTLRDIIAYLDKTYKHHIGAEILHIHTTEERRWLQERLEKAANGYGYSDEEKRAFLQQLVAADGLEKYLHKRFVGQKRFSLEGGDGLIPLTETLINRLGASGSKEIGIAMAHRGRLNMLINILGKRPADLFDEFEGKYTPQGGRSGDVKYHMGFSSSVETAGGLVDLTLAYNPSHLEFVNPVRQGSMRARIERAQEERHADHLFADNYAVPIQIHGDAAFAGQGVNLETLQLSQVRGYRVGGTLHVIVNNQIGFTTSNPLDTRSAMYCSDAAKLIQAPVLHVNGDDPEALAFAGEIAVDYLRTFHKDIFIDIVCYRRLGHNEADEPSATQPMMYKKIRAHDVPAKVYADRLVAAGVIAAGDYEKLQDDYRARLEAGEAVTRSLPRRADDPLRLAWKALSNQDWNAPVNTAYPREALTRLGEKIYTLPSDFVPHPIVEKLMAARLEMAHGKQPLDWGAAENLAYASLLEQRYSVRVSGEDCGRGTFSHRHAVIHDQTTGDSYTPLAHLYDGQPNVRIIDSILSECAVLGFEYGYSTAEPQGLTIWEAQFGDFANGAQVIIDQFITSGETKWGRYSGLTMLLPHGYEGQGPEHSSARIERYLQLCADDNVQVCVPTTPAQIFHLLRRQVLRRFRKPLIAISPKSLLRHKLAVSDLSELAEGHFQPVIGEQDTLKPADKIRRVILCSGKVYYDLLQKRRDENIDDIAILRLEQLYPFPEAELAAQLAPYTNAEIIWCQEEPRNQGAWRQIYEWLAPALPAGKKPQYVGRAASASTAAGYLKMHNAEQAALVREALDIPETP